MVGWESCPIIHFPFHKQLNPSGDTCAIFVWCTGNLQVITSLVRMVTHLSEIELCRFLNLTLNLTLTICLYVLDERFPLSQLILISQIKVQTWVIFSNNLQKRWRRRPTDYFCHVIVYTDTSVTLFTNEKLWLKIETRHHVILRECYVRNYK